MAAFKADEVLLVVGVPEKVPQIFKLLVRFVLEALSPSSIMLIILAMPIFDAFRLIYTFEKFQFAVDVNCVDEKPPSTSNM